ncbi:hypothetical protein [Tenacibaculum mesophilum]|uniref:hypothetical protein n=1 Tax=Tenacibaculum mesophilum TaxID=104268 RepID=UPI003748C1FF
MENLEYNTFFFDLPIYTPIQINDENWQNFLRLLNFRGKIDGYNPFMKEKTTFSGYLPKSILKLR